MKRSGYNVIELLVVITAISLIMAIGYKGVDVLYTNIKVQGVKSEISKVKTALARSQAVGSIYWGGKFEGTSRDKMNTITPLENAQIDECHYYDPSLGDNSCKYDNIINAEKELYKQMITMEFEYRGTADTGTFRSSQFPTSSIGFTSNINGYSGIVFSDIPGNIAVKIYENLNSPKWNPTKDGLTSDRPILIFAADKSVNDTTDIPTADEGFIGLMDQVPGTEAEDDTITSDKILSIISATPKVTMIYMYTYRRTEW